mmetsp:Transcript_61496/g.148095  ORF Transcript_61496/g.148095 Transcript_61496/m.148095 type:complete len:228 (+) Transcript_61496:484-1167(+)
MVGALLFLVRSLPPPPRVPLDRSEPLRLAESACCLCLFLALLGARKLVLGHHRGGRAPVRVPLDKRVRTLGRGRLVPGRHRVSVSLVRHILKEGLHRERLCTEARERIPLDVALEDVSKSQRNRRLERAHVVHNKHVGLGDEGPCDGEELSLDWRQRNPSHPHGAAVRVEEVPRKPERVAQVPEDRIRDGPFAPVHDVLAQAHTAQKDRLVCDQPHGQVWCIDDTAV